MCIHVYVCVHVCVHVCACMRVSVRVCVCVCVCVCVFVCFVCVCCVHSHPHQNVDDCGAVCELTSVVCMWFDLKAMRPFFYSLSSSLSRRSFIIQLSAGDLLQIKQCLSR